MASVTARIIGITWDNAKDVVTITMQGDDIPAFPNLPAGSEWRPGGGTVFSFDVPIKRSTTQSLPTGLVGTPQEDGSIFYVKYTYQNGKWGNPVPCLVDGTPL